LGCLVPTAADLVNKKYINEVVWLTAKKDAMYV